jgi:hypothetical protein
VAAKDLATGDDICAYHIAGFFPDEVSAGDGPTGHGKYQIIYASKNKFIRLTPINRSKNLKNAYDNKVANLVNHTDKKLANAKIFVHNDTSTTATAMLRAVKPISKNTAILCSYGNSKWTRDFKCNVKINARTYPNLLQGKKKIDKTDMAK